ncbi:MAG: hypothetical protein FWE68_02560, partial [Defluviitaleaceae bacterium]|nr:hypothetical protein [Defluviitaleaceae bacterium]
AAGAVYYRSFEAVPFAIGTALGIGLNIVKVIMLGNAVDSAVKMTDGKAAGNYIRTQYFLRFVLTGAVLVFAAVVPFVSLWGAAAGVLTMPFAVMSMKWLAQDD